MLKSLASLAAGGLLLALAAGTPAEAASKRATGVHDYQQSTDLSSQRRRYRHRHVYYGPRVYRPVYGWGPYYRPYRYAYYPYDRPYYRPAYYPGVYAGIGPIGFGFGGPWGWRW